MKAVLDTNILVSACWTPDGLEARTVALAAAGAFIVCVSDAIVAEYRDVLARKKLAARNQAAVRMLARLQSVWVFAECAHQLSVSMDDDDNRFLECASAAGADYLVTGNLRHYPDSWGPTRIVNARGFLTECFEAELMRLDSR